MEEFSEQGLQERLEDHAKHFDKMLEFISVDVYYPPEVSEEDWANRYAKNKANKAPKLAIKQATKKAKKARLNPANYKSVPDVQKEALEEKIEATAVSKKATAGGVKRKRIDSDSELSPEPEPQNPLEVLGLAEPQPAVTPKPSRADLKELRDRLQERINQLRAKRKAATTNNKESDTQPPPKKKQKKEKDKKKKKKKDKNKKGGNPKEEDSKGNGNKTQPPQANGVESKSSNKRKRSDRESNPDQSAESASDHTKKEPKEKKVKKQKTEAKVKADVRYGAIEFNKGTPLPESLAKKKGMNKKKLLHKLEREKEAKNGSNVSEKKAWDKLIAKAKGEKVKDNAALVKKSLKKEEQKKKKSQKEWKARDKESHKKQEMKQKKRSANIAEYLAKKKERRIAKRTGTKLKRPGFEGKKKKFLNK